MAHTLQRTLLAISFITLGCVIGVTASAVAGPNGPKDQKSPSGPRSAPVPMKVAHLMGGLELNAEQEQALRTLIHDARTDRKTDRSTRGDGPQDFAAAIATGDTVDRASIHASIDARAQTRTARNHEYVDGILDIYETLDQEQKEQLSEMISDRSSQRKQRQEERAPEQPAADTP